MYNNFISIDEHQNILIDKLNTLNTILNNIIKIERTLVIDTYNLIQ